MIGVQGSLRQRRLLETDRALGRHELVLDSEVVAAGGAHAQHAPGVEHRDLLHGNEHGADVRLVLDDAGAEDPVGVVDAAGKGPAPANAEAAFDAAGLPRRLEGPGDAHVRIRSEKLQRHLVTQPATHDAEDRPSPSRTIRRSLRHRR